MAAELVLTMDPPEAGKELSVSGTGMDSDGSSFASLTTALTGTNNDLVFTAKAAGYGGNAITIKYTDPGTNTATETVNVVGSAIEVVCRSASSVLSTAAQIQAAIQGNTAANALVSVANAAANDGSGHVIAMAATHLTGALDAQAVDVEIHGPDEVFIADGNNIATDGSGNFSMQETFEIEHEGIIKATVKRHADGVELATAQLEVFRF